MKQRIKALLAGCLLALALFGVAAAGPLEDGEAAYLRGDYATAMSLLPPLAEQGNAEAQNDLGLMYEQGRGVSQDYAQAAAWFRKAAEQGNAIAQSDLGWMYANGQGVPQDYAQAAFWYRKAAKQGNAVAQNALRALCSNNSQAACTVIQSHTVGLGKYASAIPYKATHFSYLL